MPALNLDHLHVVLVATRNPLNLGAAARAMSNFGCLHLRVVNPYEVAFREARSAVGAAAVLADAEEFKTVAEAVADCALVVGTTSGHARDLRLPLTPVPAAVPEIRGTLANGRVALLFGSEKRGLASEDFSYCHWLMRIPTREEHASMNLGQAVAVCLYELVRDATVVPVAIPARATAGELERITAVLIDVLHASGYVKPRAAASTEDKVRRLVRRLNLSKDDAELWLGMLRQILWKLHPGEGS